MHLSPTKLLLLSTLASLGACSEDDSNSSISEVSSASATPVSESQDGGDSEAPEGTSSGTAADTSPEPTEGSDSQGPSPDVPVCNPEDDLEPNESENEPTVLNNITDDDSQGTLIESILAGDLDVDWFAYMGKDVAFAYVDPTSTLETDMSLRLCLFVECMVGSTTTPDCIGSVYAESPDGRRGCCDTGSDASVSIDLTCVDGNGDDDAYVFMRVDQGPTGICVPYNLDYHY